MHAWAHVFLFSIDSWLMSEDEVQLMQYDNILQFSSLYNVKSKSKLKQMYGFNRENYLSSTQSPCMWWYIKIACRNDIQSKLSGNRVAICHGYDGYIRVKIFWGWGKKSEKTHNMAKLGLFWKDLHNLCKISVYKLV